MEAVPISSIGGRKDSGTGAASLRAVDLMAGIDGMEGWWLGLGWRCGQGMIGLIWGKGRQQRPAVEGEG